MVINDMFCGSSDHSSGGPVKVKVVDVFGGLFTARHVSGMAELAFLPYLQRAFESAGVKNDQMREGSLPRPWKYGWSPARV